MIPKLRWGGWIAALLTIVAPVVAADGNRVAYLDEFCDPYYVGGDFPKLTTPQWVGEEGVDAVIVLSIDDMRGHEKWETYLRPILDRLKEIDGRAPVSIMTCRINPDDAHLQTWLKEGLSLEVHTIDHPCPCLQGSDFAKAAKTYHDCVDLMASIPGSHPVAFRMPCCDSQNTPSPRFWSEIFNKTSSGGKFLQIDSSVFNITTPADASLPRELVVGDDGKSRFRRYLPFPSFVNTIEDYPYPYVIGGRCWEFPCVVPSDWEAQNIQRPNNPQTVADMQRALDAAVLKQGVFTLVFHPHGWIRNDQIVELIDYAEKKYGRRVKFLNFRECAERIDKHLLAGQSLRASDGGDNGVRIIDLNADGFVDVVIGNQNVRTTRLWLPKENRFKEFDLPAPLVTTEGERRVDTGGRFGIVAKTGYVSLLLKSDQQAGGWHFTDDGWQADERLARGLTILDREVRTSKGGVDQGTRLRDLDGDGCCELIGGGPDWQGVFRWDESAGTWRTLPFTLPANTFIVDSQGRDAGLRFVDINGDKRDDVIFSDGERWSAHLFTSLEKGWSQGVAAKRGDDDLVPPIVRGATNNGAWFHTGHLWVQNEDTHRLPDGVARLSLEKLLEQIKEQGEEVGQGEGHNDIAPPKSTEEALATFKTKPGLAVELVAAEPLIVDPVAFDWGPDGRLWVVEMRDYPNGLDGSGQAGGRVKVLVDSDDDGRYDRATIFLDGLPFPTGVKVWRDGVLVTAAPKILFARDTDNDGRADDVKTLYEGFGEGNQQHRVNGLRWGLDNWLYVGNGDSGGNIRSLKTDETVDVRSRDLRIQPDTGRLEAISGNTQFGIDRDDWGNWFGGNNSNPAWHYVLDDTYLRRNPHFAPPAVKREISETPGAARVYPISRTLERFNNPNSANHFTSACSPMIYRDRWLGEGYYGNVFICEPVHNLVHREVVTASGSSFTSQRAEDERESEFLASSDSWFRPAMIRTGPDGALWVADMYRLVIEHPQWIPEHFQKRFDVRAGDDRGRIYRIVRDGESPRVPRLDKLTTEKLVAKLADENGAVRDLAQQMLLWKSDDAAVAPLEEMATRGEFPLGRLHALCTLDGLGKLKPTIVNAGLKDTHPGVRRHAIRISEHFLKTSPALLLELEKLVADGDLQVRLQLAYCAGEWPDHEAAGRVLGRLLATADDVYLRAAAMSSLHEKNVGQVLVHVIGEGDAPPRELIGEVLAQAAALGANDALTPALKRIARPAEDGTFAPWQFQAAESLLAQLPNAASGETLAKSIRGELTPMFAHARSVIDEQEASSAMRVAALRLLRWGSADEQPQGDALLKLLQPSHTSEVQFAAVQLILAPSNEDADLLPHVLSHWQQYAPALRGELLDASLGRAKSTSLLLDALDGQTLQSRHFNAQRRQRLLEHPDSAIRQRAAKLLEATAVPSRAELIKQFAAALEHEGDANLGRELFAKHCAACHRLDGVGNEVGPNLAAVTDRSPAALLAAMLDPNRAVEDKFLSYTAVTDEGQIHSGMLVAEAGQSITLQTAEGKSIVLLRNRLDELRSSEKSFMPEGLERELNVQQFADLIGYLQSVGPPPKTFAGNEPAVVRPGDDRVIHLFATSARIYGSRLVFEPKYKNLGWWQQEDDHAAWTVEELPAGEYEIEIDYACSDDVAGNSYQLQVADSEIVGKVIGTGTWDDYQWRKIGRVRLGDGRHEVTLRSAGPIRGALLDLREIRLTPVGN